MASSAAVVGAAAAGLVSCAASVPTHKIPATNAYMMKRFMRLLSWRNGKGAGVTRPLLGKVCLQQLEDQLQAQLNRAVRSRSKHRVLTRHVRRGAAATEQVGH